MDDTNSFLVEWAIKFLENKDVIRKEIVNIEKNIGEFDLVIHYKDRISYFIVKPILGEDIFNNIKNEQYIGFFILNNPANIKFVVNNWGKLVNFKFLSIYFVNPFSNSDKV